jgi:hypothetical protein
LSDSGAGARRGVPGHCGRPLLPLVAILLAFGGPGSVRAASRWHPMIGPNWTFPLSSSVRDVYSSGPGLSAGLGYDVPQTFLHKADLSVELRGDWFRKGANPNPVLADRADSRLTIIPLALQVRIAPRKAGLRPFGAAGGAVILSREVFHYTIFGQTTTLTGKRTNAGAVLAAGLEIPAGPSIVRLAARGILSGGHRRVIRPLGSIIDQNQTAAPSTIGAVFEVAL